MYALGVISGKTIPPPKSTVVRFGPLAPSEVEPPAACGWALSPVWSCC